VICPEYVSGQFDRGETMAGEDAARAGDDTVAGAIERCVVHGILHLVGHDHEDGPEEERAMFELEQHILDHVRGA
jgi:rRNA maturation RNase YbeY